MQTFKTIKNIGLKSRWRFLAVLLLGVILAPALAVASTLVSQSFVTDSSLATGSIVSLQKGTTDHVDSSTTDNAGDILGVVINPDSSQISVSYDQGTQVSVATSGIQQVLVSDINGSITTGDPITSSPITGMGMKATDNVKIVGVAQDSFPNSTSQKASYKDKSGQTHSVNLGQIPVLVNVSYYYKQPNKTIIPAALQNLANSLANKQVNSLPIIISIAIFIITLIIVVSIVYSLIQSSIISVGRNPMSQAAVYRNVIQLSALVIVILGVGLGAIYMVLTKL